MRHRVSARLSAWQIHLLSWTGGLLWMTGAMWLGLHYLGQGAQEFASQARPAEAWMLRIHGLVVVPALLACGGLLIAHIPLGWVQRRQRALGVILTSALAVLIGTGYLLYYVGDEELRDMAAMVHWIAGLALPGSFFLHYVRGQRLRRRD